jgi:hypothetical protein
MRKAMSARDPELSEKVRTIFEERKKNDDDCRMHRKGRQAESEKTPIPPEERDRMEKVRAIAKQAPAVQSAEAKLNP